MKDFEKRLTIIVRKHKQQTKNFNLPPGMWGNIDPMIKRIRHELWEHAPSHRDDKKAVGKLIDSAIEKITHFYKENT